MTQIHDFLYPPKDQDTRVNHRRYDAKERLIAWSVQQDDHFLLFCVSAFREVTRENGDKLDVPETIECRFSQTDVEPDVASVEMITYSAYDNRVAADSSLFGLYAYPGREIDVETDMQYNRARCYDPTPGRWISEDALGYEPADSNRYPYSDLDKVPHSRPADPPSGGE